MSSECSLGPVMHGYLRAHKHCLKEMQTDNLFQVECNADKLQYMYNKSVTCMDTYPEALRCLDPRDDVTIR